MHVYNQKRLLSVILTVLQKKKKRTNSTINPISEQTGFGYTWQSIQNCGNANFEKFNDYLSLNKVILF